MRWQGRRQSGNIEDRRGMRGVRGGPGLALGGGATLIVLVLAMIMGVNPLSLLSELEGGGGGGAMVQVDDGAPPSPEEQELRDFVAVVLADTEDVWTQLFATMGRTYREVPLVLFRDGVQSACGTADSAVGPFYCPADGKAYLDLSFFDELDRRFGAAGDFAQAYVIAHEVGHHVQNLLGVSDRVHEMRRRVSEKEYNDLSVRLELQADFFAGVWAHHAQRTKNILEPGDLEEALRAASAIGDDTLQRRTRGFVVPDSFTHGSSAQRLRWFKKGFESGDMAQGDTFATDDL